MADDASRSPLIDEEGQAALRRLGHPALGEIVARGDLRPPHLFQRSALEHEVIVRLPLRIADQEGQIARHIRQRRVQPAVRYRHARIHVERRRGPLPVPDVVAVRAVRQQMRRRAVEIAGMHAERPEDVLVDIDLEILAGQPLDHLPQIDDAGIGIAVARARREQHLRIRQHRFELRPGRGLERLPFLVAPGPRPVPEAGAVAHQLPQRDCVRVAERIVDPGEFRDVTDDRIVERQQAAIAKLHDRDPGHRLGDRRPMIDGPFVDRHMRVRILLAQMIGDDGAAVANDVEAAPGDARPIHLGAVERAKVAQRLFKARLRSHGRISGHRCGNQKRGAEPTRHDDPPLPQRIGYPWGRRIREATRMRSGRARLPPLRASPAEDQAASALRDWRLRSCGSRCRFLSRMTLGVTSTSSSSWI